MDRTVALVFSLFIFLLFSTHVASALQPTLDDDLHFTWPSVQGEGNGTALVNISTDISRGESNRERFNDVPAWIISDDFDHDGQSSAGILFQDGTFRILNLENGRFRTVTTVRKLAPESPPLIIPDLGTDSTGGLIGVDDRGDMITIDSQSGRTRRVAGGFSPLTYPLAGDFNRDGVTEVAAVSDERSLTIVSGRTQTRSENSVELLPDTRIVGWDLDDEGGMELIALTRPTDEKAPDWLGDDLDARGIAVFSWDGRSVRLEDEYVLEEGEVFRIIQPVVVKDKGSIPLIMLTVLEEDGKTGVRSFSYDNGRLRQRRKGPTVEEGLWIHPLGGALFGDSERLSLATAVFEGESDTEGDLELYRADLGQTRLTLRSSLRTHKSGYRQVETVLIGDLDGDNHLDLLVPGPEMESVSLITLDGSRLKSKEIYNASSSLSTNFCPGDFNGDGRMDVMFGLSDGSVVILEGE